MTKRDCDDTLWEELYYRIMDESDCCTQAQHCVGKDTYLDATARMEAYDHVLKIMREIKSKYASGQSIDDGMTEDERGWIG